MVTEKKTTKPNVKSSKKPKSKKLPKKTLKLVKSSNSSQENLFPSGFSVPDLQPPDGFRLVSPTQGIMEYGKPLMEMIPMPDDVSNSLPQLWHFQGII